MPASCRYASACGCSPISTADWPRTPPNLCSRGGDREAKHSRQPSASCGRLSSWPGRRPPGCGRRCGRRRTLLHRLDDARSAGNAQTFAVQRVLQHQLAQLLGTLGQVIGSKHTAMLTPAAPWEQRCASASRCAASAFAKASADRSAARLRAPRPLRRAPVDPLQKHR